MSQIPQEVEIKFYVNHLADIEEKLHQLNAEMIHPRVYEINLRFDNETNDLLRERRVLRLRRDWRSLLTFKGPMEPGQSVSVRQELEVVVSSFETTRQILEALGYHVSVMYEKYRTTYHMNKTVIALDEMPFGLFVEIEGDDAESIRAVSDLLGLNWEARCLEGYLALFARLQRLEILGARHLTFAEFGERKISAGELGLTPADAL